MSRRLPSRLIISLLPISAMERSSSARRSRMPIGKKKELSRRIGDGTALIAFSPDGRRIVSSHADRSIRVWDVKTRRIVGDVVSPEVRDRHRCFP